MEKIIDFIIESEKLKGVERMTSPVGLGRRENSAEHSWSVALLAMVLIDRIDPTLDRLKVIEMLLVHDLVEIDAGDNFCYGKHDRDAVKTTEEEASKRIFGLLPEKESKKLKALWTEFEEQATRESIFANALDRFGPTLQNYNNQGGTWKEHSITKDQFLERNKVVKDHFPQLWEHDKAILAQAIKEGWIRERAEQADGSDADR